MRTPFHHAIASLLLVVINTSCANDLSPQEVAGLFWDGIEQGDADKVKRYITAADVIQLNSLDKVLPITEAKLARTVIDADFATIDTRVTVAGDKPVEFPLKTYLVLENDVWKIDYDKTINAVATAGKLAAVMDKVHDFSNALQDGIDRSVQELENTLPQIEEELSRIESHIKQQVPALRERLEKFAQELEDLLESPRESEKQVQKEEDPVEI